MQQRWAAHPFLIAVSLPISLYAENFASLPATSLVRPLACLLSAVVLLLAGLWLLLRSKHKAAIVASTLFVGFWGWGFFEPLTTKVLIPGARIDRSVLLLVWYLPVLALCWLAYRTQLNLAGITKILNVTAWVLVATPLVSAGLRAILVNDVALPANPTEASSANASTDRPDIYYIILDGYGRADALAKAGFDPKGGLAESLPDLDFFVAQESRSNYVRTRHSIPSSLNFDYLDTLTGLAPGTPVPAKVVRRLLRDSAVVRFLKQRKYKIISCSSGYYLTQSFGEEERIEPDVELTNFEVMLVNRTLLQTMHDSGSLSFAPYALHRRRIEACLDALPSVAKDAAPTFVIAHIVAPHHPFVFGRNGEELDYRDRPFDFRHEWWRDASPTVPDTLNPQYARAYSAQMFHLSRLVHAAVVKVLENSPKPPVIVIQGDHGPNGFLDPQPLESRYPILNAYHLPDGGSEALYETMSPVNSFRLILSYYFGANLDLLPDVRPPIRYQNAPPVDRNFKLRSGEHAE